MLMDPFISSWKISLVIWSVFYCRKLLVIYLLLISLYHLFYRLITSRLSISNTQKLLFAEKPKSEPNIYLSFLINCKPVDDFLARLKQENPDQKLTYTHIATKAMAVVMEQGAFSRVLRFDNVTRVPISVLTPVNIDGDSLGWLLIPEVEGRGLKAI